MKILKKCIFIFVLPLLAFTTVHKYYISVSNITYSQKEEALQITSRVFIDDINALLEERYAIKAEFGTNQESEITKKYLRKYIKSKFIISINNAVVEYNFLGEEYKDDMLVCYLEIPNIKLGKVKIIQVQNRVLMDLFSEQQNIVHLKLKEQRKSMILIQGNDKGMLKL